MWKKINENWRLEDLRFSNLAFMHSVKEIRRREEKTLIPGRTYSKQIPISVVQRFLRKEVLKKDFLLPIEDSNYGSSCLLTVGEPSAKKTKSNFQMGRNHK